jgi:biotin-dependent carboxylase-like uncharacterized protein
MSRQLPKKVIITRLGIVAQWTDSGRKFSQISGYSQSGAVDWFSFQLANALCANSLNTPCIEVMGGQFAFEVSDACIISITGARAELKVNNNPVAPNQALLLKSGDSVSIGQIEKGLFNYVSFAAKFELPLFKNSVCAVKREQKGGFKDNGLGLVKGQQLAFENVFPIREKQSLARKTNTLFVCKFSPFINSIIKQQYSDLKQLPLIFSYQHSEFSKCDIMRLLAHTYKVSDKLDKMGVRLTGPIVTAKSKVLRSQPMANGAIQIPGDGMPIIMRNDRQTIGGYPVIGVVSSFGLALLSQSAVNDDIHFKHTSFESAIICKRLIDIQLNEVLNKAKNVLGKN